MKDAEIQAAIIVAKAKAWQAAESAAGKAAEHVNALDAEQDDKLKRGESIDLDDRLRHRNAVSHLATSADREVKALRELRESIDHAPAPLAAAKMLQAAELWAKADGRSEVRAPRAPRPHHPLEYAAHEYVDAIEQKLTPPTSVSVCFACRKGFLIAPQMPGNAVPGWNMINCPHCEAAMEILWRGETLTREPHDGKVSM